MNLVYNIYLEVAGCFFLLVLLIYSFLIMEGQNSSNREFRRLVALLFICELLDVITAVTISYGRIIEPRFNLIINTVYFIIVAASGYQYAVYIESYIVKGRRKTRLEKLHFAAGAFYIILLSINLFSGCVFSFSEDGLYTHGFLYPVVFLYPMFIMITAVVTNLRHPKSYTRKQFYANLIYAIVVIVISGIQALFLPSVLLTYFSCTLAVMIMFFSLETPDYQNLLKTMEELRKSKEEIEFAEAEAIAANQAKSNFLANMSHEIRTPINGIIGMNTLILEESTEPAITEYARNVQTAGNSLLAIVNDILDFSRIESGKILIIPNEYQVCALLNDCYNLIYLRANEKNLTLEFENDPDMPGVLYGDEVRVRQIIMNLLTNAVKYTQKGGVTLKVGYQKAEADEIVLYVAVEDTGIGIEKENINLLFEAFQRLDETMNRNIEGTGLGLKITKQLLEMMNGNILVESEPGKGSVFTVAIPQKVVSAEKAGAFSPRYTESTKRSNGNPYEFTAPEARILVVDDVELNLKVVKGLLKKTGIHVETAMSGEECLEKAGEKSYDIIFLDHMMPEMDGIQTLQNLRVMDKNKNPDTPIVMLTANAIVGAKDDYLKAGFTDYLSKPILERQLYKIMIKYLPERLVKRGEMLDTKKTGTEEKTVPAKQEGTPSKTGDPVLDQLTWLDLETGLSYCANDIEFYKEMIETYLENAKLDQLETAYKDEDWENYTILIHGVKSSSLTIGAVRLSGEAKALEHAAKEGNAGYIEQNQAAFMEEYQKLIDDISAVIKG
ncbi:MAG: ATP-binding protein [Agathobacter sp.]